MRFGIEHRHEHLAAIDRKAQVERARQFSDPRGVFHERDLFPLARAGIRGIEHGHVVLLDIIHYRVALSIRRESGLVPHTFDGVESALPDIRVGHIFLDRQI